MHILVNQKNLEFHLYNENISYILKVLDDGTLGHLYFGKKIKHRDSYQHLVQFTSAEVPVTPNALDDKRGFCKDILLQEYPSYGNGDYREPAIVVLQENGSRITDFTYHSYEIVEGKENLKNLPNTYVENSNEAKTLKIYLKDELIGATLTLSYTIFRDYDVITRNAHIKNESDEKLILERFLSASLDFKEPDFQIVHLSGAWSRERHVEISEINQNKFVIDSKRGTSSVNSNPFIALKRKETTEFSGEVYGFNLVYSGNHIEMVEKNQYNKLRVSIGMNPFNFNWTLLKGDEFQSPEVVMSYSNTGMNGLSLNYHRLYRERLARGVWRDKVRPVLLNNWEATYFDFNEEKILDIAKKAKELGVELFVLDDGWFGARNHDKAGLGDWWSNLEKIPSGVEGLSKKVEEMGIKFGLWFEPEMVNKDSELYRNHPNWILRAPNRKNTPSRNQHTLDLGREDVREYLYEKISKILRESKISYVKWDMNRPMTEVWSEVIDSTKQGEVFHRYILGLYELLEKLTTEFPEVLFESCASGGNRFDPGMLYYMPQTWTSDDTDAVERIKIQYGTSLCYPVVSMGAHVSAVPNHQTNRITPIKTRGNVAIFGAFGYELDLNKITDEEKEIVKKQIEFFKENRELIQFGDFYRLVSPFEKKLNDAAWMVVSKDKKEAIVAKYKILSLPNAGYESLLLSGLNEDYLYSVESLQVQGESYYGDELHSSGLIFKEPSFSDLGNLQIEGELDSLIGDFKSCLIKLKSI
ncbi:alpha-galactosidase [uncultured Cetobacterium sp.]|uniref:alpha-galactosidase n=1 Tax=uncultured Cetobacterium sp. TaxID=527638 RepID=UPI0025DFBCB0|nr:alpha-galactosidase [uncultured Cetobacterium sp.]